MSIFKRRQKAQETPPPDPPEPQTVIKEGRVVLVRSWAHCMVVAFDDDSDIWIDTSTSHQFIMGDKYRFTIVRPVVGAVDGFDGVLIDVKWVKQ